MGLVRGSLRRVSLIGLVLGWTMSLGPVAAANVNGDDAEEQVWAPSPGDVIAFDVLRQGNRFGTHIVSFESDETGALQVNVDVDLRVKFGPLTVFKYALDSTEVWQNGELLRLQGEVNDDGTREAMSAEKAGDIIRVTGDGLNGDVPGSIIPASHWNMRQIESDSLLSSENGELIRVDVVPQGREIISAGGQSIEANRYLMDSDIDVTLWYDDQGRWLKLAFTARGQSIEYQLRDLY